MTLKINKSMSVPGIYKYTDIDTHGLYIGSAMNCYNRYLGHASTSAIDVAIYNKGIENFTFEIIEELPPNRGILLQNERKWIDYYDAVNNPLHYNESYPLKYTMWDATKVSYSKTDMYRRGNEEGLRPRYAFRVRSPTYGSDNVWRRAGLPIGRFNEFVSPAIIYDLCEKWS